MRGARGILGRGPEPARSRTPAPDGPVPSDDQPMRPSSRRRVARRARQLLGTLGDTPGAVALSLLAEGARGAPWDPNDAPLTAYLSAVIGADPDVESVTVDAHAVTICTVGRWRREVTVTLPAATRHVADAFDQGLLPLAGQNDRADGLTRRQPAARAPTAPPRPAHAPP